MPKLLILTDWFTPGYKAGGPIRSCLNLAKAMRKHFQVFVLTADTDEGETLPYSNVVSNKWVPFEENIKVYYLSAANQQLSIVKKIMLEVNPNIVYLNSMFSRVFTLFPLILQWQNNLEAPKIILTPRGMLHAGAMQYKSNKKRFFLFLFRLLGMSKNISFQATDEQEVIDIQYHLDTTRKQIYLLENLPDVGPKPKQTFIKKDIGKLNLVFISRITAKKNLDFLLDCLRIIPSHIELELTIYGPIEAESYWQKCEAIIKELPPSVNVTYKGSLKHEEVRPSLQQHHFFILLTHGENFGHAIFEAFAAGVPVIISDQTPWLGLVEKNTGWALPLIDRKKIEQTIIQAALLDHDSYEAMSISARNFAEKYISDKKLTERYLALFRLENS